MPRIMHGMLTAFFHVWILKGVEPLIEFYNSVTDLWPYILFECCSQVNTAYCIRELSEIL